MYMSSLNTLATRQNYHIPRVGAVRVANQVSPAGLSVKSAGA